MLHHLLLRHPRRPALASPSAMRVEVCPPALFRGRESLMQRWLRWLRAPEPLLLPVQPADSMERLREVRREFAEALFDIDTQHAEYLSDRMLRCRSLRELWHLRPEMFNLIAVQRSQEEAERRLAILNRHFPTRAPRSGFAPLDS